MIHSWPGEFAAFLRRPVPIFTHLAASCPGRPPFSCRGYAFREEPDPGRLWFFVLNSQWPRLNEYIKRNERIAALLTSGVDNESYQCKGIFAGHREATGDDADYIARQARHVSRYFPDYGALIIDQPGRCTAVALAVASVYVQTPGPRAGALLTEGGGLHADRANDAGV